MNTFHTFCPRPNAPRFLTLLFLLTALRLSAQTTWNGSTDTDWSTAANWSAGVPDVTDDVTIPDVANEPVIMDGTVAVAKSVTVDAGSSLTVNATGSLTINGSDLRGIFNQGVVTNNGQINIGSVSSIGLQGIYNTGTWNNNASGEISIDRAFSMGIYVESGAFTNAGLITIGAVASTGDYGIDSRSTFSNSAGGEIRIDRSAQVGLQNVATFANAGKIIIGAVAGVGVFGIFNYTTFSNNVGGEIGLDRSTGGGLNTDGPFTNAGKITIGALGSVGNYSILNYNNFQNTPCTALIRIISNNIIYNNGAFSNAGSIIENANGFSNISSNTGIVQNLNGGAFTIGSGNPAVTTEGAIWTGCVDTDWSNPSNWLAGTIPVATEDVTIPDVANDPIIPGGTTAVAKSVAVEANSSLTVNADGSLTINGSATQGILNQGTVANNGTINIGSESSVGNWGIHNQGLFSNNTGGEIKIDRAVSTGVYNSAGSFDNADKITIGAVASAGSYGIYTRVPFNNNTGGEISIDQSTFAGVYVEAGTVANTGKITIGATASIGYYGIDNRATFHNNAGGEISIDRSNDIALHSNNTVTNAGKITIGAVASVGGSGIQNWGAFDNDTGGEIKIDRSTYVGLWSISPFTNSATITIGASASIGLYGILSYGTFDNNAGGEIKIDRSSENGLQNGPAGTFTNVAKITIGAMASVGQFGLYNRNIFNNNAGGELEIDRSTFNALYSEGTFTNVAKITIGAAASVGPRGLFNVAVFHNNAGGEISIDRTSDNSLWNFSGTFTNSAKITIGAAAVSPGQQGIYNKATFYNNAGGEIKIDRTTFMALYHETGTFTNAAKITIGAVASVGTYGIRSRVTFDNNTGGEISIDRTGYIALYGEMGSFTNAAKITIGALGSVGSFGILNEATFNNAPCTALIRIVSNNIISNNGSFSNAGGIIENAGGNSSISTNSGVVQNLNGGVFTIGSGNAAVTTAGAIWTGCTDTDWATASNWLGGSVPTATDDITIPNVSNDPVILGGTAAVAKSVVVNADASLTVNATGSLTINGSAVQGIFNQGMVENNGTIVIGSVSNIGQIGIYNEATFNNNTGGEIRIDRSIFTGIYNEGTITNAAIIILGAMASTGQYGIFSRNAINNNAGGEIRIDRATFVSVQNTSGPLTSGIFTNAAKIIVGAVENVGRGIYNDAIFNNIVGGEIIIVRSTVRGLLNGSGTFTNAAKITIGTVASVGHWGFVNSGIFNNNTGGEIHIDRSTNTGLFNGGTLTNAAKITIGVVANVGLYGIENYAIFNNNDGSEISIDRTTSQGILNVEGTFTNAAQITIGAGAGITGEGIRNQGQATLQNTSCATLTILAPLNNSSTFTNSGLFTVNTASAHTNSALTNNGIIEYPQGNPIPNVTNNDLVVAPVAGECAIMPALQIGGSNSFTAGGTWYADPNLSNPAGDYNQATNTFTINNLAEGTYTLYCSISDNSNGCPRTVSIQVAYDDVTKPTITCPANLIVAANGSCSGAVGDRIALASNLTDNCGAPTVGQSPAANTALSGHNDSETITLTANDGHGNTESCTFTVTLKDVAKPTITCPANLTVAANGSCSGTVGDRTALAANLTDNCGTPSVSQSPAANTPLDGHNDSETVTLTAADGHGNTESCTFTVTLKDVTPPTALCKAVAVQIQANNEATIFVADVDNNSTDNCSVATRSLSKTVFTCADLGANTVTLTVTDINGLSSTCNAVVTINDPNAYCCELPDAGCKAATVALVGNSVTVSVVDINNNSIAGCGLQSMTVSPNTFNCSHAGAQHTVTLTVTDINGNSDNCQTTVTVVDNTLPTITCPTPTTVTCSTNVPAVNLAVVTATDNCSTPVKSHVGDATTNQTCVNRKTVTRTYRATDASGNSATCAQAITVFDNVLPVFTSVPANVTVQCNSVPGVSNPTASDGCGGSVSIVYNGQTVSNQTCADSYLLTRLWTATDACGNTKTATQRITVTDTQKPNFVSVPANITVQCSAVPGVTTPVASDNCDAVVAVTYNGQTQTNGACPNAYTLTRTWTAADNCGNTRTVTQRISVVDTGKPAFTSFPENITIACNENPPPAGSPTASDGCAGTVTITYLGQTSVSGNCPGNYQIRRTWRATDACGNSTAATQTIQVHDTGAPVFTFVPANITIQCNQGLPPVGSATASDACGYAFVTFLGNMPSGSGCAADYTVTRTWEAEDLCGNTATASQVITVLGNNYGEGSAENRVEDATGLITRHASLIALFPNPTTNRVWLDLTDFAGEPVTVSIFSDLGQLVWQRRIPVVETLKLSINLREAGAVIGLNAVHVHSKHGVAIKKVLLVE